MDKKLKLLKERQEDIFVSLASLLGAMASPVRIRLIHFLSQAPLTVEVAAGKVDESIANTSMHLRKMLNEGLVSVETLGQKRAYSLAPEALEFWEHYQSFAQKLDPSLVLSTSGIYGDLNWTQSWSETKKLAKAGEVLLLDVRPNDEVIEGDSASFVLHIPQSDLKTSLKKLPKKKPLLVFCRGRLCALSAYSVNYLREMGFNAYRLDVSGNVVKGVVHG
jgi:rhodanese-related sulfurtransferase/DNA-binding MarR family transcriptional regulator